MGLEQLNTAVQSQPKKYVQGELKMEFWQTITENIIQILTSISIIVTIVLRSAKQKNPEKQAEWEEQTAERRLEQKRKRLFRLRNDDEEMKNKLKTNLEEEIKLEKELGENA